MSNHPVCDKCGKPVPPSNDAVILLFEATGDWSLLGAGARHLLPTEDCEGSPSRAEYIEGQPRDTRGYEYDPVLEKHFREAYTKIQCL